MAGIKWNADRYRRSSAVGAQDAGADLYHMEPRYVPILLCYCIDSALVHTHA